MSESKASGKRRILLQLDPDANPSVFDGVVAVDAGAEFLFRHGNVSTNDVRDLIYGLMFTRGGNDLRNSAVFIGGSDVAAADAILEEVTKTFFGPVRVSVMADPSGANTTAAAAVVVAGRHLELQKSKIAVLAATGPVGQRVARLLCRCGSEVVVVSRKHDRATKVAKKISESVEDAKIHVAECGDSQQAEVLLSGVDGVIAAGAPGVQLLSKSAWQSQHLRLMIDLNAVPPVGIEGVDPQDRATKVAGEITVYGAIGVGHTKMKIHKAAVAALFDANDRVLDVDEIFDLAADLGD